MSKQDKTKWNHKYAALIDQRQVPSVNPRLLEWSSFLTGGTCLDLACGLGANSLYLAEKGYQVMAVDISEAAIEYLHHQAQERQFPIIAKVVDLDKMTLAKEQYDLIVITYFLDRRLFSEVKSALKPGGLFFMETFYLSPLNTKSSVSQQFKLASQELKEEFSDWNLIHFSESEELGVQSILTRKP